MNLEPEWEFYLWALLIYYSDFLDFELGALTKSLWLAFNPQCSRLWFLSNWDDTYEPQNLAQNYLL